MIPLYGHDISLIKLIRCITNHYLALFHTHTQCRNAISKLNSDMLNSMDCYCSYEAESVLKLMHFKLEINIASFCFEIGFFFPDM